MEILQGAGLNVPVANDGWKGVDAAVQNPNDAILMDIQMPVMDGYTATRKIREWESDVGSRNAEGGKKKTDDARQMSENRGQRANDRAQKTEDVSELTGIRTQASNIQHATYNIPIIAMTTHAMSGDEQKSLKAGMNGHVTKPIDPDQLFSTLLKWIKPADERIRVPKSIPAAEGSPVPDKPLESDRTVFDESELPESLPGFDLAAGLARLMDNKTLYRCKNQVLINRLSRRGVENMEVVKVESQFQLLVRVNGPSPLALSNYL